MGAGWVQLSILYHYTSQHGLLGILGSKSIWATNTQYLNDHTEFVHALSFASSVASYFFDTDYWHSFSLMLRKAIGEIRGDGVYVASLSEKPDLLSQWRGYCPGGNGYCIGFDQALLAEYCDEKGFRFEKCLYGHEEQQAEVTGIITSSMGLFPSIPRTVEQFHALDLEQQAALMEELHERLSGDLQAQAKVALDVICESLIEFAPRFKNEGFHEEAEWRVIVNEPSTDIQFRPGPSYVIPYITMDLIEVKPNALRQIIVGPNPNQSRALKAVELLVRKHGHSPEIITRSNLPLNFW